MRTIAVAVVSLISVAMTTYVPNDVEKGALECIRSRYDSLGALANGGKLQVGCMVLPHESVYDNVRIQVESNKNNWKTLPPFAGTKCDPETSGNPLAFNAFVFCAGKLLGQHCGKETTASKTGENIQELMATLTPKQKVCASPPYVLNKLEVAGLACIYRSFESVEGRKGTGEVHCSNRKFHALQVTLIPSLKTAQVQFEEDSNICQFTSGVLSAKAIECAKQILGEICNSHPNRNEVNLGLLRELLAEVRPKEKQICQNDS